MLKIVENQNSINKSMALKSAAAIFELEMIFIWFIVCNTGLRTLRLCV